MVKKKMKMEMRRGRKEVDFLGGTYSLKTTDIQHVFTWYLQIHILEKMNLDFPSNKTHKLKDLEIFKVLWTTYQHFY